jgi:predicted  nucleic acid-binding Zn-ribbon protein
LKANLAKIRSEETALKPPDVEALEEDKEKLEEAIADIELDLSKLNEKYKDAAAVILCLFLLSKLKKSS